MSITDRINSNLSALFNPDDDEIFKALICDQDGTISSTITKPDQIDIGVLASQIEYLRLLSITLLKQMYIDEQDTEFLEFTLNNYFDSLQLSGETEVAWLQRVINKVFSQKVSNAAIIYLLRPYSPGGEPTIEQATQEHAFCDFSYCDIYSGGSATLGSETVYFLPAVLGDSNSAFFTIKITLFNTPSNDIFTVIDYIDEIVAAGIEVILEISYT